MDDTGRLLFGLMCLVLVASSLFSRRISMGQIARMIFLWIGIFAFLFVIFAFRPEFISIWERVKSDISGTSNQSVQGREIILTRRDDGHFWLQADVNGQNIEFLVDSGASGISMGVNDADLANIEYDLEGYPVLMNTANGTSKSYRAEIRTLKAESIKYEDVDIFISPALGNINLLGMSFLNRLQSWRVEGNKMILQP